MGDKDKSQVSNPFTGAAAFGLGGALCVLIGAAIRDNNIHNEAMTVLVGGVITGAIAGSVGCFVPNSDKDSSLRLRFTTGVLNSVLGISAFLTGPLMGEECLGYGTDWGQTVVDELIGVGVLSAGVCAAGVCAAVVTCGAVGTAGANGFFSKVSSKFQKTPTSLKEAQNVHESTHLTSAVTV